MPHQFPECRFQHFVANQLGYSCVSKEVRMHMWQARLLCVIGHQFLDRIDAEGAAASLAFEGYENSVDLREKRSAFFLQIPIQSGKGQRLHEHKSRVPTFRSPDADTTTAALDVFELDG